MYKPVIEDAKSRMEKTLTGLKKEYSTLRAGRANPQILDKITVDYYGTPTPLSGVANISSPEPRLLVIAPWEAKMIGPIEKAIQKSDLGINPNTVQKSYGELTRRGLAINANVHGTPVWALQPEKRKLKRAVNHRTKPVDVP